jgi:hypothetical protein
MSAMSDFASALPGILVATLGEPLRYMKGAKTFDIDGIPGKALERQSSEEENVILDELAISVDASDIEGSPSSGDRLLFRGKLYEVQYPMPYANGMVKLFLVEALNAASS